MTEQELLQEEYNDLLALKNELKEKEKAFNRKMWSKGYFVKKNKVQENPLVPTFGYNFVREDRYVGEVGMMYDTFEGLTRITEIHYKLLNYIAKALVKKLPREEVIEQLIAFNKEDEEHIIDNMLFYEDKTIEDELGDIDDTGLNKLLGELYQYIIIDFLQVEEYFFDYGCPINEAVDSFEYDATSDVYNFKFKGSEKEIEFTFKYMTEKDYNNQQFHEEQNNVIL